MNQPTAYLLLEDGSCFAGQLFGAEREVVGEVVVTTTMTGYQEIVTDPSSCGQIVAFTYPLIGNYGINQDDYESLTPYVSAIIVKEYSQEPSHWKKAVTLEEWMKQHGIPGLHQIDTRALTRKIRAQGTMKASLIIGRWPTEEDKNRLAHFSLPEDYVRQVSTPHPYQCPGMGKRVVVIDLGMKASILRALTKRDCDVRMIPSHTSAKEIMGWQPDGVVISNGPGNPKHVSHVVETIRSLLGKVPLFGIGLGHQLLALACGADTEKMRFGHRGGNYPVQHVESKQTIITAQNHGYTVTPSSLERTDLKITYLNVNDGTVEGIQHRYYPAFSVQFHPEAAPGPMDSLFLFDQFVEMMKQYNLDTKKGAVPNATS